MKKWSCFFVGCIGFSDLVLWGVLVVLEGFLMVLDGLGGLNNLNGVIMVLITCYFSGFISWCC